MSKRQREDHHAREVDISNPTPVYSSNKQHRVEGESLALRSIVRSGRCEDGDFDTEDPITSFFRSVWQAEPRVYRRRQVAGSPSATADDCPLNQVITMGLDGLVILLEASRARFDKQRLTPHQTYVPVGLSYVSVGRLVSRVEVVCRIRPLEREG